MRLAALGQPFLMRRTLYWPLIVSAYAAAVVYFLRDASPVFFDGSGPMPSFYGGRAILPTAAEYYSRRAYFDNLFLLPYVAAALIITVLGCGGSRMLVRRVRLLPSHPFWGFAGATLILLVAAAAVSDVGSLLGAWRSPLIIVRPYYYPYDLLTMAKVFVPPCVLSGLAVIGESRFVRASK